MRKVIAMLLVFVMLCGMMPAGLATEVEEPAAPETSEPVSQEETTGESEDPADTEPVVENTESTGGEADTLTPPEGVQEPSEKYYHADHKFGYDSMAGEGTVVGASVSVGSTALTEGSATSTNAAALADGVTITFQPGYYLHSYKIVCGDKYSCNTDAQGMAVHVTSVMTGATQASYKVTLTKTALGHSSEKGPYWILLDIRQDEAKYKVTYNWGTLEGRLTDAAPATETHLVNDVVTVKEGSADAIAQAKALGYRFLGWSHSVDGKVYQPGGKFGMPAQDVALTALWEAIPQDTLNPGTGSLVIPFTKNWDDSNNAYNLRPETLTVKLYKYVEGGEKILVEEKTLTKDNWSCTFDISDEELTDEEGNPYKFAVEEVVPAHYTEVAAAHQDPDVIFNPGVNGGWDRITPCSELSITTSGDYKSVVVVKKGNQYIVWTVEALTESEREMLFESAVLNIEGMAGAKYANTVFISGTEGHYGGMTVTTDKIQFSASENWSFFATGYYEKSSASANSSAITNKLNPQTVSISGSKIWDDGDDQDGMRPASITVRLYADGVEVLSAVVTAEENWTWTFEDMPKYADGKEIVYTVSEDAVEGYTTRVDGYNVTNTHIPEKINISGSKTWDDGDNQDGIRPESITIHLLANGEKIETVTVTAENEWKWSFTDLPKYADGEEIVYTITEEAVDGYETIVKDFDVTNSHTPSRISVAGAKTWNDGDDQDGIRPESITVRLLADGEEVASKVVTADDGWKWSFTDLPEFKAGVRIVYTVTEDPVDGYNVTNTHIPETVTVEGEKTWDDYNNQDGIRPQSITVNLLANGEKVASQTVTAGEGWKWSFTDLPKYAAGQEIIYTVSEEEVDGYTAKVEGFNITNTHVPETIDIEGTKTWNDAEDQDGKRPDAITVRLYADDVEVIALSVTADTGWSWSFKGMPKFANGKEIVYTVAEDTVEGYTAKVEGFNITNTHVPETVTVSGSKTWQDNDDQDGIRPESITVNLLADGQKVASRTVTAENGWKWTFADLPKYADGKRIVYTIEELEVDGYITTVVGYNVINVHIPETVTVSGSKTWNDGNDRDGIRPDSITVNLLANGVKVDSVEVKASLFGNWKYSFRNLPKYEKGVEIVYTVTEEAVEGYTAKVEGFDITNTHETEKTELNVRKVWDDKNDENKKRPTSVKITLYANGKSTGQTLVLSAANNWAGTFKNLEKNEGGKAIKYTVKEETVNSYKATYSYSGNTATVTNTFSVIPVTGDVSGLPGHILMMGISAAAILVLGIIGKRRFLF